MCGERALLCGRPLRRIAIRLTRLFVRVRGHSRQLVALLATRGHRLLDLRFHGFEIEACAFLRRREVDEALAELRRFLLDENTAPEFVHVPVDVPHRASFWLTIRPVRSYGSSLRLVTIGQSTLTVLPNHPVG